MEEKLTDDAYFAYLIESLHKYEESIYIIAEQQTDIDGGHVDMPVPSRDYRVESHAVCREDKML